MIRNQAKSKVHLIGGNSTGNSKLNLSKRDHQNKEDLTDAEAGLSEEAKESAKFRKRLHHEFRNMINDELAFCRTSMAKSEAFLGQISPDEDLDSVSEDLNAPSESDNLDNATEHLSVASLGK